MTPRIRRGSTPRVVLRVGSAIPDGAEVRVAVRSSSGTRVHSGDELSVSGGGDSSLVAMTLSQEETLAYVAGEPVRFQVRVSAGGSVMVTEAREAEIEEALDGSII